MREQNGNIKFTNEWKFEQNLKIFTFLFLLYLLKIILTVLRVLYIWDTWVKRQCVCIQLIGYRAEFSLSIIKFKVLKLSQQLDHVRDCVSNQIGWQDNHESIEYLRTVAKSKDTVDDIRMYDIVQIDD